MFQEEAQIQTAIPVSADREPYRRLIELQKQMIELVQRHERTKRECSALRKRLLEEMARPRRWPWNLRLEIRWLKNFSAPGTSGWRWARNQTTPLFLPAKQQIPNKPSRPNLGKF